MLVPLQNETSHKYIKWKQKVFCLRIKWKARWIISLSIELFSLRELILCPNCIERLIRLRVIERRSDVNSSGQLADCRKARVSWVAFNSSPSFFRTLSSSNIHKLFFYYKRVFIPHKTLTNSWLMKVYVGRNDSKDPNYVHIILRRAITGCLILTWSIYKFLICVLWCVILLRVNIKWWIYCHDGLKLTFIIHE